MLSLTRHIVKKKEIFWKSYCFLRYFVVFYLKEVFHLLLKIVVVSHNIHYATLALTVKNYRKEKNEKTLYSH